MGVDCALGFINYIYSPYIENGKLYFWEAQDGHQHRELGRLRRGLIVNYDFGGDGGVGLVIPGRDPSQSGPLRTVPKEYA